MVLHSGGFINATLNCQPVSYKYTTQNIGTSVSNKCSSDLHETTAITFIMALTSAEKTRHWRERQKAKFGAEALKQKDAARKRAARKNNPQSTAKNTIYCRQWHIKKRAAAASLTPNVTPIHPYSHESSLTRATKRATSVLPPSPRKRHKVIQRLNDCFVSKELE